MWLHICLSNCPLPQMQTFLGGAVHEVFSLTSKELLVSFCGKKQQVGDEDALGSYSRGSDGIYWKQVRPTLWFLGGLALAQGYAALAATNQQFTGALTSSQSVLWICVKEAKFNLGVETEQVGNTCSR